MARRDTAGRQGGNAVSNYIWANTNPPVFITWVVVILVFLAAGAAFPNAANQVAQQVLDFITSNFGWFYILAATLFLFFVLAIMLSRYGRLRLGSDDSTPEYRTLPWFAMLFTTGMGVGLVFFGVYEPPYNTQNAPIAAGDAQETAAQAMSYTLFHYGLHPWGIYIVLGLTMGFFCFRKGLPLRPASGLYPLIGDRIYGWIGYLVDVLAIFGTLFGLATSLGLGALQVNAGLSEVFGLANNSTVQIAIIALITAIAATSVLFGIDKGLRRLALINLGLAVVLMLAVFAAGPKLFIMIGLVDYTGQYAQNFPTMSMETFHPQLQAEQAEWQAGWTLFYWGWWISWSPFVGMFLARISYGRTIRQFIGGALFAPAGASIVWFSVLGGTGLFYQLERQVDIAGGAEEAALFTLLGELPVAGFLSAAMSVLAILVVGIFFATSSDSGSLVVEMLTNGGDPNPKRLQRTAWAVLQGAVAAVLLLVGGELALEALQAASLAAGLPFAVVLLALCVGIAKGLAQERLAAAPTASRIATSEASKHDRTEGEPVAQPGGSQRRDERRPDPS